MSRVVGEWEGKRSTNVASGDNRMGVRSQIFCEGCVRG